MEITASLAMQLQVRASSMISVLSSGRLAALALAAGCLAALAPPVRAQTSPVQVKPAPIWPVQPAEVEADVDDAPPTPAAADADDPDMKDIDVSKLD
jgi:hypothetical protein